MTTLHFFTEYYYPAQNSTSFYISRIIDACAKKWEDNIRVFCASPNHDQELLVRSNIRIVRFSDSGFNKNTLLGRLLKFLLLTLKFSVAALLHVKSNDRVFAVTNPAFMLIFLAFLRKIRHFRFILLVYDIFPEVLIPGGLSNSDSIKYRLALKIFNWAYNSADRIIVIGRDMQEVVENKIKDPSKVVFIPNWSDTEHIISIEKKDNPILRRLGIEKGFVFSIAGNMGRTQGLDNLLNALSLWNQDCNTAFLFMGGGAKEKNLRKEKETRGLTQVYITGWIPDEEQNAMLSACDVAVISLAEGMFGLSVPSKSYFNMAAGKPLLLIADERSEIARIIAENQIGWVVPPNNPKALAKTLDDIQKKTQEELRRLGGNARTVAESLYCERIILPQYVKTICT